MTIGSLFERAGLGGECGSVEQSYVLSYSVCCGWFHGCRDSCGSVQCFPVPHIWFTAVLYLWNSFLYTGMGHEFSFMYVNEYVYSVLLIVLICFHWCPLLRRAIWILNLFWTLCVVNLLKKLNHLKSFGFHHYGSLKPEVFTPACWECQKESVL